MVLGVQQAGAIDTGTGGTASVLGRGVAGRRVLILALVLVVLIVCWAGVHIQEAGGYWHWYWWYC